MVKTDIKYEMEGPYDWDDVNERPIKEIELLKLFGILSI